MRIVGLMSGTSLDGVDAALIETDGERILGFGPGLERPYTRDERAVLARAVEAARAWSFEGAEPDFSDAEAVLTRTHEAAVRAVCDAAKLAPDTLDLVGFHGQTVLHRAPSGTRPGRTRQIGDGQALADALGCPVAFDFRSADVAAGGQGAPLAPVYHAALIEAAGLERPIGVLNLGGVGNITHVDARGALIAFDTGPANGLIDAFMEDRTGTAMDTDGATAAQGRPHEGALADYLDHAHFGQDGPKSLDRWDFSLDPVRNLSTEDGAATLSVLTARTVGLALDRLPERPKRLVVCGGGRRNRTLLSLIETAAGIRVHAAEAVGWRGDLIEAEAFAYLAARTMKGLPISFPGTTGVDKPMSGGRVVRPR
ncbi:anhydro-N-acetylmuramic acid kinase [Marinicauda algicola]|uniref:Anhydro-N-acetylmuramic acid kinase n=1 Tax=Marinicauda algicola TaxID=2029849 RepID=A0A4S2H251_9PROT|nr:anhydro-N-acetylmuramic acid kinase [Marinicauda algicola]TGY89594.1 anhydro-N-acetylmuramic acid kinase [Marinicauda algicola]